MLRLLSLLALIMSFHLLSYADDAIRGKNCGTEEIVSKSKAGSLLTCKEGKWEHHAFDLVNVQLYEGQFSQDPNGCLYVALNKNNQYVLMPIKGDDGKPLCRLSSAKSEK